MLSLQDSVFFEMSIKSLLKSWSSGCKYAFPSGRCAEVFLSLLPFFACQFFRPIRAGAKLLKIAQGIFSSMAISKAENLGGHTAGCCNICREVFVD